MAVPKVVRKNGLPQGGDLMAKWFGRCRSGVRQARKLKTGAETPNFQPLMPTDMT